MNTDYSVLVIGCKKHEEIAERYFELANIYWNNSIEKTIFCTDVVTDYQLSFTKRIVAETSNSFANRILRGIRETDADYLFVMLDDYYLTKEVAETDLNKIISYMKKSNVEYCKLIGMPKCFSKNKDYKGTYHIKQNTHYGISLQPSIWKRTALVKALNECTGSSAWEVEAAFSVYQKNNYKKCLTFNKNLLNYRNGVLRGKLFPYTNKILKKNDIEPLKVETISCFRSFSFMTKQHIAMHLPVWVRKLGKKIGRKGGKKYYSPD